MIVRSLRLLVVLAVTALTSGIPQVVAAAVDDDCCAGACDGALDGKHCPPNCDEGVCAKVHASLAASAAPLAGPVVNTLRIVVVAHASPPLPVVSDSVFHPPRH